MSGNCSNCSPLWSLVTAVRLPCHHSTIASPAQRREAGTASAQAAGRTGDSAAAMGCMVATSPSGSMPAAPLWLCPALCWLLLAASRRAPRQANSSRGTERVKGAGRQAPPSDRKGHCIGYHPYGSLFTWRAPQQGQCFLEQEKAGGCLCCSQIVWHAFLTAFCRAWLLHTVQVVVGTPIAKQRAGPT